MPSADATIQRSVWRPLSGPVRQWPLALCDAASVDAARDLERHHIVGPRRVKTQFLVHASPEQRWYYLRDQMPNEALLFRQADSAGSLGESGALRCPHPSTCRFFAHAYHLGSSVGAWPNDGTEGAGLIWACIRSTAFGLSPSRRGCRGCAAREHRGQTHGRYRDLDRGDVALCARTLQEQIQVGDWSILQLANRLHIQMILPRKRKN